jgi:type VI protein secretion system component Hcp
MKLLLLSLLSLFAAVPAFAQTGTVLVNVNGITCTILDGKTGFEATVYSLGGTVKEKKLDTANTAKPPALDDLSVGKSFDDCSSPLIKLFLGSTIVPTVTLIQYGTGDNTRTPVLTITLTNAVMTSYEVTGAPEIRPTEVLTFTYKSVCISSASQKLDGTYKPPVTVCYDTVKKQVS